jgi:hypothetical protein
MLVLKACGIGVAALVAAYAVSPYHALYRLADAVRRGDAATLDRMVDWDEVREGVKEDICDQVLGAPTQVASNQLPAFGSGFVRGIAGSAIDASFTPKNLVAAAQAMPQTESADTLLPAHVEWAFFDGPTTFVLLVDPPGHAAGDAPVRVQMELRHGAWQVTRAWLPPEILQRGSTGS